MTVIFLFPLVFSVIVAMLFITGDFGMGTKVTAAVLVLTSLALQFLVPLPDVARFLAPLFLQLIVCGWWYIASQFE